MITSGANKCEAYQHLYCAGSKIIIKSESIFNYTHNMMREEGIIAMNIKIKKSICVPHEGGLIY